MVKPLKQALASKNAKPGKAVKSNKSKKAEKPSKKVVAKKVTKKIVTKKTVIKKAAKSVKKALKKSVSPSSTKSKPKKAIVKKVESKPKKLAAKKTDIKKAVKKPVLPKTKNGGSKVIALVKPAVKQQSKKADKPEKNSKALSHDKLLKTLNPLKSEAPKPLKSEKSKPRRKKKKVKDDDDEPVIGNDPLIEEIIRSTKKRQQTPKKPKIIQTFVNPMASLTVATDGKKPLAPKKEPKGKFELEYVVRTSAGILFEFLTSPSGLSEWFADDVNIRDGIFTFFWDGSEQKARLLSFKEDKYVRMQWLDKPEGSFFEFKIEKDELTGDISLIITDFADEGSDLQTSKRLWDSQVNSLLHVIGSY